MYLGITSLNLQQGGRFKVLKKKITYIWSHCCISHLVCCIDPHQTNTLPSSWVRCTLPQVHVLWTWLDVYWQHGQKFYFNNFICGRLTFGVFTTIEAILIICMYMYFRLQINDKLGYVYMKYAYLVLESSEFNCWPCWGSIWHNSCKKEQDLNNTGNLYTWVILSEVS